MEFIAEQFADELKSYSLEVIREAMREHGRKSGFLPRMCELIALCKEFNERKQVVEINVLPLPTELSEKQRNFNLEAIKKLREKIGRRF